ncbi:hypothetical protein BMF94_1938 [Rhodotorula taiwanensis]|uniref:Uncharacterized protein n=1 Tax=Rhodotorula taiwanensis TaxID=741276 RepID=A0A2S5BDW1_9BASI|nr:hypothetical protein BMF94_1938 [Rhodotorula taiwanensis]
MADPLRSAASSIASSSNSISPPPTSTHPPHNPYGGGRSSVPAHLTPTSSRANSLDRAGSPVTSMTGSNPFRDPSLDWVRGTSFENDAHSILSSAASESAHENGGYRPSPGERRPSEVQRDLSSAVREELPRISEDSLPPRQYTPPQSRTPSSIGTNERRRGLLHQFRTGSGWFAPLVEPEAPMSREERAAAEKARIEKLKDGRASTSARRPGLMKRMSSGVEMGFNKNRDRSGSQSTVTGPNR